MTEEEKAKQAVILDIVVRGDKGESLSEDELFIYNTYKKVEKEEKSWFARNYFWIVVGLVIFIIRMCRELSK